MDFSFSWASVASYAFIAHYKIDYW